MHIADGFGRVFKTEDYIKYCYELIAAKQENKSVPYLYESPLGVQFELTYRCNQNCIHCYNQSSMDNTKRSELSLEEWKNIARELGRMGVFQCIISGGEPTLLGEGLFEIMDILHGYCVTFVVITNGMQINESNICRFAKYRYNWFQVSIDGSRPELHDYARGVESFDKAIKAADFAKRVGMPLVIAHSVMKHNKNYFGEMIDLAYLLGAARITAGPFCYTGRAVLNNAEIALTDEEIMEVYEVAEKKAIQYYGTMEVAVPAEEVISLRTRLAEPNSVLLIRPNGDVKFDCINPFKIGNTRENTMKEIWSRGMLVHNHPRLIEYVSQVRTQHDLLKIAPLINVDPDEMLIFENVAIQGGEWNENS